ncbi:putative quinol monooxygenase [Alteromonas sp. KUL49]|uniref:putative quinol monooxygenase n=1 Tax=Alteromonas sp. KUL49 TaxID=2480798 RepID=UPI00102F0EDD|nr:putative quinol monooxygenase [Alteromonas sp. KUL49]TAP40365.1 antibiotic biosynthesis monooxygenase [Alteromonas sp. KUL49]GEA11520.1 hypothetical protein KUL49_18950 [Alteromonas sp. KUL49]
MYCIFATITPKKEHFRDARAAILSILEPTRSETGCNQFDVHTDEEFSVLYLYEQWIDQAALKSHYEKGYTKRVFASYEHWLAKPVDIKSFTLLD